jgi:Ca2+:H+ antiporter
VRRALRRSSPYLLLGLVPAALFLRWRHGAGAPAVFVTSALATLPLAALMGRATEQLADRLGEGLGGLLNATLGNAAELIIAGLALRRGLHDLVKASITGSIIGNILLVFGLATLTGGVRHHTLRFNRTAASMGATMLAISAVALVVPAIFDMVAGPGRAPAERNLSLEIAVVLVATYLVSLVFTLGTHRHLYMGHSAEWTSAGTPRAGSAAGPVALLALATTGVVAMAELLVGAVAGAARALGWNEVFVGVVLVATIGNAAEHSTAVLMAWRNRMDAALGIAIGSSIQIALFVAPLLVFLSYVIGQRPLDLVFTPLEVVAVALAVGVIALIAQDGESHYMEGVQLLAVYLILGLAFFELP